MSTLRTFVAVEISPEVRAAALRLIERLRAVPAKVTWTKGPALHYTVKFLGDMPAEQAADVCRAVQEAVAPFSPFELVAAGAGAFPSASRARTLWLGAAEGAEAMELVYQAVQRTLQPLGIANEHRPYRPHLTLGRVRQASPAAAQALAEVIRKHAGFDAGAMQVRQVAVFSSTLTRDGPRHDVLARCAFRA